MWASHSVPPSRAPDSKGKSMHQRKKNEQILYVVTGQSTALDLYSPETLTVKDLKGAEHSLFSALVGQLLATGAWRFPQWQPFSLKRRVCATHAPVRVRKALLFNNYFQQRHWKNAFRWPNVWWSDNSPVINPWVLGWQYQIRKMK